MGTIAIMMAAEVAATEVNERPATAQPPDDNTVDLQAKRGAAQ